MKNIAVLVYDLINEYSCSILEGITEYCKSNEDIHCIIAPIYAPFSTESEYSYHYWSMTNLLASQEIDSVIIISNSFTQHLSLEELAKNLKGLQKKHIVSVAVPLKLNNCKYTHTLCEEAYDKAVTHFVEKHNVKRCAFFSADLRGSPESKERQAALEKALKKHGLQFSQNDVIVGDFTPGTAVAQFHARFPTKESMDYDAIFCVNDFTVLGCIIACVDMGIKVPEDLKVIGFDDDNIALITHPTFSSINQNVPFNGYKAAEIAYRLACEEEVQKETLIQSKPVFRQSCGCVKSIHHSSAFVDENEEYHAIDEAYRDKEVGLVVAAPEAFTNIHDMLNIMDAPLNFKKAEESIKYTLTKAKVTSLIACFYEEPIVTIPGDDFELPEIARILVHAEMDKEIFEITPIRKAQIINPQKHIVPKEYDEDSPGKYFVVPVFQQNKNFGYILCKSDITNFPVASIYMKILNNILIRSYEYVKEQQERQMLFEQKHKLNLESKTDELTHILNRRGFMEYGQRLLSLSIAAGKPGLVFFCDLDGLKTINDTYGHEVGDAAILTEAQVLTAAFRNSDMIGRLSGDEFGVVAPGFSINNIQKLRDRLSELNELYSKENELPFILSISVGPIEFGEENDDLQTLLTKADDNLYVEKKKKHSKDKNYYKNRLIPNPDKQ